ncbi:MAG: hypothetical protein GC205_10590 [Bacteroidetes bacterium]|nr:hypothetical protein [Bacteroidota bacterium]
MKASAILLSVALAAAGSISAQNPLSQASIDFTYTMASSDGTNASAVTWHPGLNLFFTAIAGNAEFPIEAFNTSGKNVYTAEAQTDVRGLWYNSATGNLEVNSAGETGWSSISFNKNMTAHQLTALHVGQLQPDFQSVGVYNAGDKKVAFLNAALGNIDLYPSKKPTKVKSVSLSLSSCSTDDLNQTSIGCTGVKDFEYVLLNVSNHKLVFVDKAGKETATTSLPEELVSYGAFKFAFAGGRAFLYETETRTWTALRVF